MAFAIIGRTPGGTAEQDLAVSQAAGIMENRPAGVLARLAGPTPDGWRVISVWESREDWTRFYNERLAPAFRKVGGPAPEIEEWDLQSFMVMPK